MQVEKSNFGKSSLTCMAKPKFGKFSLVGEDDRLIDNVDPPDSVNRLGILKIGTNFFLCSCNGRKLT